ncbi:MAG TPA: hypothetical protein VGP86_08690 [Xanthobacteraceae bacterium]|nr:hypothetical protein [Xanthobacteraceae bacterium]
MGKTPIRPFPTALLHSDLIGRRHGASNRIDRLSLRQCDDIQVAGIALAQNAAVATRNVRHFDDPSIAVIDPWQT